MKERTVDRGGLIAAAVAAICCAAPVLVIGLGAAGLASSLGWGLLSALAALLAVAVYGLRRHRRSAASRPGANRSNEAT